MQRVYFIQHGDCGPIEIGVASDVEQKLRECRSATNEPLRLLAVAAGGRSLRRRIDYAFTDARVKQDLYESRSTLLDYIDALTRLADSVQPGRPPAASPGGLLTEAKERAERAKWQTALARNSGNISRASTDLGISKQCGHAAIRRLGLVEYAKDLREANGQPKTGRPKAKAKRRRTVRPKIQWAPDAVVRKFDL